MQSWDVLGAALKRPVAGPAWGVDIHMSSGSGGGFRRRASWVHASSVWERAVVEGENKLFEKTRNFFVAFN